MENILFYDEDTFAFSLLALLLGIWNTICPVKITFQQSL